MLFTPSPPSTPPKVLKRRATSEPTSPSPKKPLADVDTNRSSSPLTTSSTPKLPPVPAKPKQGTLLGFITRKPATARPTKRPRDDELAEKKVKPKRNEQLVFTQGTRQTCKQCNMAWMRGVDDELHAQHHSRVLDGVPVTKAQSFSWTLATSKPLAKGSAAIYMADYTAGKVTEACDAVDRVLSAATLPTEVREKCKVFLAVVGTRIVGVAVSQPIKHAMAVIEDSGDAVKCDPKRLPTPLGIHRVFTVPSLRGQGLAVAMLDAAAGHTVYGRSFKPEEAAFSQPTEGGRKLMRKWGVTRVFEEDDQ
ncbi:hypothetical protein A1Q2_04553 [Trichosporon asahii var. asahii CBS 8904]|uniref:N-acetyltransferase ESCO acetyl-transferase domain-containing protein n=1 Tax=Trichosporon asahii var. asahii (strain CBS 8904) TaxID=1220162 RepID=K1VAK3_TRIAC|nr:hypothetical protein A1Q2_04553 [Trichosporon asahii var. asahii CBS 8904]